jgi:choice-of-anchor B domain-containing protein
VLLGVATTAVTHAASKLHCTGDCLRATEMYGSPRMYGVMEEKKLYWAKENEEGAIGVTASAGPAECIDGVAGGYPCDNVDLLSFTSLADLGSVGQGNDIWGWTDSEGREYVIAGCSDGSSMVDVTDPENVIVLGFLPTQTVKSSWRDMKVFKGHAFIGSEATNHGLQVFDLSQLSVLSKAYHEKMSRVRMSAPRNITEAGQVKLGVTLQPTVVYNEFGSSHNIVINEATGFLYAVGTKTCAGGLHMVDINNPQDPQFVGCYSADGYTHDAECVVYKGPDEEFQGHEICFNYNEDTLTIVDVTHKDAPKLLSRYGYEGSQYTHQGWLNQEQTHLLLDDELDEQKTASLNGHTRTMIWDVTKLQQPTLVNSFYSEEQSIDHNQYIHRGYSWQSNYCAGLRVLDTSEMSSGTLSQRGFFDVSPECNTAVFSGTWSNYPYFASETIAVQSIEKGLFLVKAKF